MSEKILVVCGAGMTSSILVSRMREYVAEHEELDYKIGSCAVNQMEQYVPQADIVFIAPHLAYLKEETEKKYPEKKIVRITSEVYGTLDGAAVLVLLAEKKEEKPEKLRLEDILVKVANRRIIRAISAASYRLMPVLIIGGIFTLLQNFPFQPFMDLIAGTGFETMLKIGEQYTTGCISVYMAFLVAYQYGREMDVSGPHAGINSLVCFFLILNVSGASADMTYFGARGVFCSFITAFLSVKMFGLMEQLSTKFTAGLERVPKQIYMSFFSLIPMTASILVFTLITAVFALSPYGSFPEFVYQVLQNSLSGLVGEHIIGFMISVLMIQLLWFVGIHGGNVINSIMRPILLPLALENLQAYRLGLPLPHIIHSYFLTVCTFGGAGSTLILALLMRYQARSAHMKELGKIALPMGIFFINEPIILGLPIMMNPILLAPFILVPEISVLLTYTVMKTGLVPAPIGIELPWTTPMIISGLLQGGWRLAVWQAVLFVIQGLIWYPFFRLQDRKYAEEESVRKSAAAGGRQP